MFFKLYNQKKTRVRTKDKEGLKIVYDDVAPYAKENSNPQIIKAGLYPHPGLYPRAGLRPRKTTIKKELPELRRDDLTYPGYALCYPGFSLLNGQYINFPKNPQDYGYISEEWSNENGDFSYSYIKQGLKPRSGLYPRVFLFPGGKQERYMGYPALTITFNQKFSSVGIFLTFNTLSGDYASSINIKWYGSSELLSSKDFFPDSPRYFCNNYVGLYDKIVITFKKTSKPYRPVFLTRIDYGIYRDFLDNEILQADCLQEIDSMSETISINTLSFTVRTKSDIPFDLQKKQRLGLYFDRNLIGNFYLKSGSQKSRTDFYMDAHDAIGVLDGNEYPGGIYAGQLVPDVIKEIFGNEDFTYYVDDFYKETPLYGYIPYTTKRNALQQIAFAIGAIVDTSDMDYVAIYPQQTDISGEFNESNTFEGVTLERTEIVTGIRLTVHSYQESQEIGEIYKGVLAGAAEVIFSEPYHNLSISGGTIIKSGYNFAIISGDGEVETLLTGKKYSHITNQITKENPNISFNKNIKEVTDATLIHSRNAQEVLERVYDYYQRSESVTGDVLMQEKVVGQFVEIGTGYAGKKAGILESADYSFGSSIRATVRIK
jgi:hypothetical protein